MLKSRIDVLIMESFMTCVSAVFYIVFSFGNCKPSADQGWIQDFPLGGEGGVLDIRRRCFSEKTYNERIEFSWEKVAPPDLPIPIVEWLSVLLFERTTLFRVETLDLGQQIKTSPHRVVKMVLANVGKT